MKALPSLGGSRVFGLDLMRALSLILIMCVHASPLFVAHSMAGARSLIPIGVIAVEIFFVLSGFLIGQILLKLADDRLTLKGFLLRRWFRTLPNYFLFLILNFLVYAFVLQVQVGDWRYFVFAQNLFAPMQVAFFPESWTLAAEEWFYFLTPMLLVVARAVFGPGRRAFFAVAIFALLLYPAMRIAAVVLGDPHWDEGIRKVVYLRLDTMMYGVALAGVKQYLPHLWQRLGGNLAVVGAVLLLGWLAAYALIDIEKAEWLAVLTFSVVPAGCAAFLPYLDRWQRASVPFWDRWITNLSLWSYSMYLLHFLLMMVVLKFGFEFASQSLFNAFSIVLVWAFVVGYLGGKIYRYFELPCTNLRDRFTA